MHLAIIIKILYSRDRTKQLNNTKFHTKDKSKDFPDEIKAFQFQITLVAGFKKEKSKDETKPVTDYLNPNSKLIINDLNIHGSLELPYEAIMSIIKVQMTV